MGFLKTLLKALAGDAASSKLSPSTPPAEFVGLAAGPNDIVHVVGESHYQVALDDLCGGKREGGHDQTVDALLIHDPANPYDKNAVGVFIGGQKVGHLGRGDAARFVREMAAAGHGDRPAVCAATIVGGWDDDGDEGSYGVRLKFRFPLVTQLLA